MSAALLGVSGAAVGDFYTTHTDKGPVDAEDLRLGGPGERLDPAAPDFGAVIASGTADISFPSVSSRRFAIEDQVRNESRAIPGDEAVSLGAVRAWVADAALCAWSNQWAAATHDGDRSARAEAVAAIHRAPRWPAVVAIDPDPYHRTITQEVVGDDGTTRLEQFPDESQFYYLAALGAAVDNDDPDQVAAVLARDNGYCSTQLMPDLPQATPSYRNRCNERTCDPRGVRAAIPRHGGRRPGLPTTP